MHKTETWNLIKGSFLAHLFLGNFPWIKILKSSSSARNNSKVVIWLWGMRRIHQLPLHKGPIIPSFHHHHHLHHLHHPHHHHHHPCHHNHHVQHHYHHRDGNSSKIQPHTTLLGIHDSIFMIQSLFSVKICIGNRFNLCEIRTPSGCQMVNLHKIGRQRSQVIEPFNDGRKCKEIKFPKIRRQWAHG